MFLWRWLSSMGNSSSTSDVPNPGVFDDLNQNATMILHPNLIDGLSFNFNTPMSDAFAIGSAVEMGAKDAPGVFAFNANYFTNKVALISRSTPALGRVFARVIMNHSPTFTTKMNADVGHEPDSSRFSCDFDYRGVQSSSQVKLASGRIIALTHLHALTKAFSLGGEALIQARSGLAAFTVATKYHVPGHTASFSLSSFGPVVANYIREVNPKVSFATELFVDGRTLDSSVTFGYRFDLTHACVIGHIDSKGKVAATLEERINPAFTLTLCGELDHSKNVQTFGIGVNIGAG